MNDRRVHARTPAGLEVVRYDRAGKWAIEAAGSSRRVPFAEAVRVAAWICGDPRGQVFFDLPGGKTFDARVRAR